LIKLIKKNRRKKSDGFVVMQSSVRILLMKYWRIVLYYIMQPVETTWRKTSNHLPLTAVGSNPDRDFGFFHVRKLSS
jgi:hypothetical protein